MSSEDSSADFIDEDELNKELSNVFNFSMKKMDGEIEKTDNLDPGIKKEIDEIKNKKTENDIYDYNLNFFNFPLIDTFFNNPPIVSDEETFSCLDSESCNGLTGLYKVKFDTYGKKKLLTDTTKRTIHVEIDDKIEYDIFRITLKRANDTDIRNMYLYRKLLEINEFFIKKYEREMEFYIHDIEQERHQPDCLEEEIREAKNEGNKKINVVKTTISRNVYANKKTQESDICESSEFVDCKKDAYGNPKINYDMTKSQKGYKCKDALDSICDKDCKNFTLKTFIQTLGKRGHSMENIFRIFLQSLKFGAIQSFKEINFKNYTKSAGNLLSNYILGFIDSYTLINILLTFRRCKNGSPTLVCANVYSAFSSRTTNSYEKSYENDFIFDYYYYYIMNSKTLQYDSSLPEYAPHVHSLHFPNSVKKCGLNQAVEYDNVSVGSTLDTEEEENPSGGRKKTRRKKHKKTKRKNKTKRDKTHKKNKKRTRRMRRRT